MTENRRALIVASYQYQDPGLRQLVTPTQDAEALARVLRDPDIGGFDQVETSINHPSHHVRRAIARFFAQCARTDLLFLYFSGHGLLDAQGHLHLAAQDTERDLLSATAIPATFVSAEMDCSRSRRQVLILDCCHSGAFDRGTKGAVGARVGTAAAFEGTGYGRVVLTATDATQYAWEGDRVIGQADRSVFTHYLVHGLETGEADADADGRITLDELYDYVYAQMVRETSRQTPGKWTYKQQGDILIAHNPRLVVEPAKLPSQLQQAIESPFAGLRAGVASELERLLHGNDEGLARAVRQALMPDLEQMQAGSAHLKRLKRVKLINNTWGNQAKRIIKKLVNIFVMIPEIQGLAIVNMDGLVQMALLPDGMKEGPIAAMASFQQSLFERVLSEFGKGRLQESYFRQSRGSCIVLPLDSEFILAVLVQKGTEPIGILNTINREVKNWSI